MQQPGASVRGVGGAASYRTGLRKEATNSIIRDSKGLAQELRALLKRGKNSWDREVEFQREALRKLYLQIIFSPHVPTLAIDASGNQIIAPPTAPPRPSTSHASRQLDVINLLWLETSHALINVYRTKVTEMDKAIAEIPSVQRGTAQLGGSRTGGSGAGPGGRGANSLPGPTARRRLLHSFKEFLGVEEDFFRSLASRISIHLYPTDLVGLAGLGIAPPREEDEFIERQRMEMPAEEKAHWRSLTIPLVHKALICYGDLARYKELYSDPSGNSSLASTTAPIKGNGKTQNGKKGVKGKSEAEKKPKNWARAAECYNQARLLIPDNGNPSNQLAVLSMYSTDYLSSTYHYYRAISVREPFSTARTNLGVTYTKALGRYFGEFGEDGGEPEGEDGFKFATLFVALHALFYAKERAADIPRMFKRTEELFEASVRDRQLSSNMIVKAAVTSMCALWNARMFRSGAAKKVGERKAAELADRNFPTAVESNLEPYLVIHVISLYRTLLKVGAAEIEELASTNASNEVDTAANLALNISAALRRTLPAMRILSKWMMGQLEYIARVEARLEASEKPQTVPSFTTLTSDKFRSAFSSFWVAYCAYSNAVLEAFPAEALPNALADGIWLEEDVDMLGFAPLRRGMKEGIGSAFGMPLEIARVGRDVHPNEEQLMRVADGQTDAKLIARSPVSPIEFTDGVFRVDGVVLETEEDVEEAAEVALASERLALAFGVPFENEALPEASEAVVELLVDDELEEDFEYQMTEDDPVDLAMRIGTADGIEMDVEDDDEEEQIVYQSSSQNSPARSLPQPTTSHNAGDLLQRVLLGGNSSSANKYPSHSPTHPSIWSAPKDSGSLLPTINPTTVGNFESIPNVTSRNGSFSNGQPLPLPLPVGIPNASLYSGFSTFSSSPSRALPLPTSFGNSGAQNSPNHSGAHGPFSRGPLGNDGWDVLQPQPQQQGIGPQALSHSPHYQQQQQQHQTYRQQQPQQQQHYQQQQPPPHALAYPQYPPPFYPVQPAMNQQQLPYQYQNPPPPAPHNYGSEFR